MRESPIRGLYGIVDNVELAGSLLEGGARILQLRMKDRPAAEVAEVARSILRLKPRYDFIFVINDHLDLARELDADGYHGGKDDPPIDAARKILGPDKLIGCSSHSVEEAVEAETAGADYIAFGAIYRSPSKGHNHPVQGIKRLKEVVSRLAVPVVAIGGIGRDNIKEVLSTGVVSVAMISALANAPDRVEEARFFAKFFV